MSHFRTASAVTVTVAFAVALAGCATTGTIDAAGTTDALSQPRAQRSSAADGAAAEMQGRRLADAAAARAAVGSAADDGTAAAAELTAAEAQGARLAQYAEQRAAASDDLVAPDADAWSQHRGLGTTSDLVAPDANAWSAHRGVAQ